jgi:hypothetical protein
MASVTVLAASHIDRRKLQRRLNREGYATVAEPGHVQVARHGRWDAVEMSTVNRAALPAPAVTSAKALLGLAPRDGLTCAFEGEVGESDAWPTVLDIARAVAELVPLAVLDDRNGTTYLVHPRRGLVPPAEYEAARQANAGSNDLLRRFLGDRI